VASKKQLQFDEQSASFRGAGRCLSFFSIAENGCPTGPTRSNERQAAVVEMVIRTLYETKDRLNIIRYTIIVD
jgi:hypothetical protein